MTLRGSVVVIDDAVEDGTATHRSRMCDWLHWNRCLLVNPLMRTTRVVVRHIFTQDLPQMRFIEDDQLLQTFVADRFHPTLRIGIGVRRTKGRQNDMRV